MNPSGPRVMPPDQESAYNALSRQLAFHQENASTPWLKLEEVQAANNKMASTLAGLNTLLAIISNTPPHN